MAREYSLAYLTSHRCTPPEAIRIAADTGYAWVGLRPFARLPPGEGSIDLEGLFGALPADPPVSVEVVNFEREANASPREWAAECLAAARRTLGENVVT